ncbi:MAG: DinB family protein [Thermoanaerobaculia bacterium]
MDQPPIRRPGEDEYPSTLQNYFGALEGDDLLEILRDQLREIDALAAISDDKARFRYQDGKWSVKEVLGHLADSERVFAYRAMRIGRGDDTPMPGFDEQTYAAASHADTRAAEHLAGELRALRQATIALFESLDPDALSRRGVANTRVISARALGWTIAGHFAHHGRVLRERYGV